MIDCRFSKPCPSQIALRLLVILPGALNSAETADQKRRNPSWSLEPACKGAEWDWDDLRFKKAEDNIGLKTAETSCWRKQFSWDSIEKYSKLLRVRWYVQGFVWQHMRLETKTLSYDTPTWDSCLLDRAQRREHPLDRCCNIHWTASNRSAWLTIKCCRVCKTSTPHLPPFALVHPDIYSKCLNQSVFKQTSRRACPNIDPALGSRLRSAEDRGKDEETLVPLELTRESQAFSNFLMSFSDIDWVW